MSPTQNTALILAIAVLALTPIIPSMSSTLRTHTRASLYTSLGQEQILREHETVRPDAPTVEALAALVFDPLSETTIFGKNENQTIGIASLTKIMTAIVALEQAGADELIFISPDAIATEGIAGNLLPGDHLRLKDLIAMMMMESSNDAAASIAEHIGTLRGASSFQESQNIFVSLMNEKAYEIGLMHTIFQNPTGLDINEDAGIVSNISTAYDVALLVTYAEQYPSLWEFSRKATYTVHSFEGNLYPLSSINALPQEIPGITGGKTGFTDTTHGSLVSLAEIPLGHPVIIVILGSSREGRFKDTILLADWLRN
ncbi:MAG: hypothetical protein COU90_04715 [Candidatus Ryanbacteria bacterium CG10_big_fil_rev_8_21_14_0_10_43_42]|uniref:Peptidase S11 D-alanyl-D-alanine carboxypeptidase A N-terminal domain-containing protein n=1 Tax=Candidatus Ryanbacteria bacterium CG10_big_fil_rev_8_21_14_0_10_43_42 TaxID=1974864 RepID=A0A2M8KW33_9BACT|nr:MAG: hypothetical protein COU90_04715 [Candidatus Ryanbacteria bacterium CG10_big_fil_rev_8_21_14_0_10_43_42]